MSHLPITRSPRVSPSRPWPVPAGDGDRHDHVAAETGVLEAIARALPFSLLAPWPSLAHLPFSPPTRGGDRR
jgi:hypothetical protein